MGNARNRAFTDPNPLASHLHGRSEREKSALAATLHDRLGGLMVAAIMDLSWAEQNMPKPAGDASADRLRRARDLMRNAVDLKRQLIEELRPTLLENVGLFSALQWLIKGCRLEGSHTLPTDELALDPATAIAVYRFAQEALLLIERRRRSTSVATHVSVVDVALTVQITGDGADDSTSEEMDSAEFESLRHRILSLNGSVTAKSPIVGYMTWTAIVPLAI